MNQRSSDYTNSPAQCSGQNAKMSEAYSAGKFHCLHEPDQHYKRNHHEHRIAEFCVFILIIKTARHIYSNVFCWYISMKIKGLKIQFCCHSKCIGMCFYNIRQFFRITATHRDGYWDAVFLTGFHHKLIS